jgi:hypothetical protein
LALSFRYGSTQAQHPRWHEYFRKHQPPTSSCGQKPLALPTRWVGPERNRNTIEFHLLDRGHLALEEDGDKIVSVLAELA